MPRLLSPILSRWELDRPEIHAQEAQGDLRGLFPSLRDQSLVRPLPPAGAADCSECSRRCRVEFIADTVGQMHGFIHCPDCGIAEAPTWLLQRWEIDTGAMLAVIFRIGSLAIQQRVPKHLWRVGKATWAGRSRQVWFARAFRRGRCDAAVNLLRRHEKAIVFAPTESGAERWREAAGNFVIPLDAVVSLEGDEVSLDIDDIEGRIVDAGMGSDSPKTKRPKKRGERLVDIETLRDALIQHLRSACDYAYTTRDQHGVPRLLPRPTQKTLGKVVGMNESRVSRCLRDEKADELRLYWGMAQDLDQIMRFKGAVNTGRRP